MQCKVIWWWYSGVSLGNCSHKCLLLCVCFAEPEAVYALLNQCHPHMTAYLKKDIPDQLHYKNNKRIQQILLIADEGWSIVQRGNKLQKCTTLNYLLNTVIARHLVNRKVICNVFLCHTFVFVWFKATYIFQYYECLLYQFNFKIAISTYSSTLEMLDNVLQTSSCSLVYLHWTQKWFDLTLDSWQFETSGHKYSIEIFIFTV